MAKLNLMINQKNIQLVDLAILGIIWLGSAISDRIWFAFDHSVPAWDQAAHLTNSLTYWQILQHPQWFSGEWWTNFWMLSSKMAPLTYILTVPFLNLFGLGEDQATLVYLLFSAILLISVYGLGIKLFNRQIALWAAGLCILMPGLFRVRLDFLLDYPLTTIVTLSFWILTLWWNTGIPVKNRPKEWLLAAIFGLCFGLGLLVKQTFIFFLFVPLAWVVISTIQQRYWERLAQLISGLGLSVLVFGPWYRINWLIILTSGKRATIDSAIAKGEPGLDTLNSWIYYWKILPYLISWPLLLVPIVGLIFYGWKRSQVKAEQKENFSTSWKWLIVFIISAYGLSSLNVNKDPRYVLPYLPEIALLLAFGLTCWTGRWAEKIRWGTISLSLLLMLLNIWSIGDFWLVQLLSPLAQRYAYLGQPFPHAEVIQEVIKTEPYLSSNIGVLPSTAEINQHNINYYGALQNFQVSGRQVGVKLKDVPQDFISLPWFLTKTGNQGSVPLEPQTTISQAVETGTGFQLQKSWLLPDQSTLKLYHRRTPPVQVQPLKETITQIKLEQVNVPAIAPPGAAIPVTYQWVGPWEQLQSGFVLITWHHTQQNQSRWLHDRAIGTGTLTPHPFTNQPSQSVRVIEQMAMSPGTNLIPGNYTIAATYFNQITGESYPIKVPSVTIKIDPQAPPVPALELDLVTQLRTMGAALPQGLTGLIPIFAQMARINQYDPNQNYYIQAEQTLAYRLNFEPDNVELTYALALSRALQRKIEPAIAALQKVVQLDSQNPYAYAYLAFVNLYDFRPTAAETVLNSNVVINSNRPEILALKGIAALMKGNLIKAWNYSQATKANLSKLTTNS